ncbi:hypothetical protein HYPSUDRAFT_41228 [Hypholoma sublateritium FD-334 SS-4]|uniref:Uncharacterized protein n=1 Tax=Hypholoma sublateritium (strain FD-334 SS-4) TaxID=945553 RepID=A0A0D2NTB5_HYPSF|nr:hypothetical protein HYPSUDRAFT_41228 [Hypholoma sublateritium FD-334 SS-4]
MYNNGLSFKHDIPAASLASTRHSPLERIRTSSASQSNTAIVPAARPITKPQNIFPALCELSASLLETPEEAKVVVGVGEKVTLIDSALAVIFLNIPVAVPKSADKPDDAEEDASLLEDEDITLGRTATPVTTFGSVTSVVICATATDAERIDDGNIDVFVLVGMLRVRGTFDVGGGVWTAANQNWQYTNC